MAQCRSTRLMAAKPGRDVGDVINELTPEPLRSADVIDPEDPAYWWIMRAGLELLRYDFDLTDPDIAARCVKVGREDHQHALELMPSAREQAPESSDPFALREGEVVYYARLGSLVKIGWTRNLPGRTRTLNPEEIMVVEPGNRVLEFTRHEQFADQRVHGEWFQLDERLMAHIEELRGLARDDESRLAHRD